MTWIPGLPMLISDRLVIDGGWIERKGVSCFNLYRPPRLELGDAGKVEPWLEHARDRACHTTLQAVWTICTLAFDKN